MLEQGLELGQALALVRELAPGLGLVLALEPGLGLGRHRQPTNHLPMPLPSLRQLTFSYSFSPPKIL
ncbi:MAG: hypothetical protein WBC50_00890 [Dehalococcoidales bacterium]